jgi:hypothetical protein
VTVQKALVAELIKEEVAIKSTVMFETSASKLVLIVNVLVEASKMSQEGFRITTPFCL